MIEKDKSANDCAAKPVIKFHFPKSDLFRIQFFDRKNSFSYKTKDGSIATITLISAKD